MNDAIIAVLAIAISTFSICVSGATIYYSRRLARATEVAREIAAEKAAPKISTEVQFDAVRYFGTGEPSEALVKALEDKRKRDTLAYRNDL
jgi:hypothetical protein